VSWYNHTMSWIQVAAGVCIHTEDLENTLGISSSDDKAYKFLVNVFCCYILGLLKAMYLSYLHILYTSGFSLVSPALILSSQHSS